MSLGVNVKTYVKMYRIYTQVEFMWFKLTEMSGIFIDLVSKRTKYPEYFVY